VTAHCSNCGSARLRVCRELPCLFGRETRFPLRCPSLKHASAQNTLVLPSWCRFSFALPAGASPASPPPRFALPSAPSASALCLVGYPRTHVCASVSQGAYLGSRVQMSAPLTHSRFGGLVRQTRPKGGVACIAPCHKTLETMTADLGQNKRPLTVAKPPPLLVLRRPSLLNVISVRPSFSRARALLSFLSSSPLPLPSPSPSPSPFAVFPPYL
jgi:hypothetical protein